MKQNILDFIGATVTERDVKRQDRTLTFHFREMSALEGETLGIELRKLGDDVRGSRAKVIVQVVCDEDGAPLFTEEEANELPSSLSTELQKIAFDVNGLGTAEEDGEGKK